MSYKNIIKKIKSFDFSTQEKLETFFDLFSEYMDSNNIKCNITTKTIETAEKTITLFDFYALKKEPEYKGVNFKIAIGIENGYSINFFEFISPKIHSNNLNEPLKYNNFDMFYNDSKTILSWLNNNPQVMDHTAR